VSHWRTRSARAALCIALGKTPAAYEARKSITRRVRDAKQVACKTANHNHTTTMADKWRVPQRRSIKTERALNASRERTPARRTNTEDHFAPPR